MKYLFFDIECSNCYNGDGKICEFGYVLTDEKFKIISQDAIPMSPGRGRNFRFDETIYKRDKSFEWAYDFETYQSCKEFDHYHAKLKKLFEEKDLLILGYAVENDIRYICSTCDRYRLPYFDYAAYDVQMLMKKFLKDEHKRLGLQNAFITLCGHEEFIQMQAHLSRDDAKMTMRIVQEICKDKGMTLPQLLQLCPNTKINAIEYYKSYLHNKKYKVRIKLNPKAGEISDELFESCREKIDKLQEPASIYGISGLIKSDLKICQKVCSKLKENNLLASKITDKTNIFICLDEDDIERISKIFKRPYAGKMITVKQFLADD